MTHHPDPHPLRVAVLVAAMTLVLVAAACGRADERGARSGDTTGTDPALLSTNGTDGATSTTAPTTTIPRVEAVPGMPPVVDPNNIYSEAGAGHANAATAGALSRVYVPNEASNTLTVIDPATRQVIATFPVGAVPQHVVPSYDMRTLYVLDNTGNSITPIDPLTGEPGPPIPVSDPYNLYFTPDGNEAIVVAEAEQRLDFTDPKTFALHSSIQTHCAGLNHLDYSADGRYFIATCEFEGTIIKVDVLEKRVVGTLHIDIGASGKADPLKNIAQPQDVRVANDGKVFYIADLITDGVYVIDGETFSQIGFIHTGVGTHGLYPSRDGQKLYVVNRGTNVIPPVGSFKGKSAGSISVLDFATRQVEAEWPVPGHGSPDMGNLTADGTELWLGGRYDAEVYVFDTRSGQLIDRIKAGQNPHGLTVWPQPGRYSFGHTGNMR